MNRFLGATLLVCGMSIGTGMLALPIVTASSGFFPTMLLLVISYFFMLMTAFMLVDVNLRISLGSNLISMTENTLGKKAKLLIWICYLFLFYALQAAHIAASIPLLQTFFPFLPSGILPLMLLLLFGGFIYAGTKATDKVNRLVIGGLILGYLLLVLFAPSHIDMQKILHFDFKPLLTNIPVVLISFGFQNIVPTINTYLSGNKKQIYLAITLGSFIPFLLYAFWEFIVLGTVPLQGPEGLSAAYAQGLSATVPLMHVLKTPLVQMGTLIFSFCAILTSFLGISLALIDFLIDGLNLPKNKKGRACSFLLAFLFPVLFVYLYPQGFLFALQFAGIIAVILVGILPCLMAFSLSKDSFWKTKRGRALSLISLAFFIFVEGITILLKMGFFKSSLS